MGGISGLRRSLVLVLCAMFLALTVPCLAFASEQAVWRGDLAAGDVQAQGSYMSDDTWQMYCEDGKAVVVAGESA